jgi:hypothetical protein
MHVHLPKPLHGWREFAGEVGIIVFGVLIALGAEQLVEAWSWHNKVGIVRASIMSELGNDRARWEANVRGIPCSLGVIDRLNRWAEAGAPVTTRPDSLKLRDQLSMFWMHSANWNLAAGSQALDHFPVREQIALAALYDAIVHREIDLERENDLTIQVQTFVPLASDPAQRRDLLVALGKLRSNIGVVVDEDAYMKKHFDAVGVKADRSDFESDFAQSSCAK